MKKIITFWGLLVGEPINCWNSSEMNFCTRQGVKRRHSHSYGEYLQRSIVQKFARNCHKNLWFYLLFLCFPLLSQTNTEVVGKVVTDSIQIKAGATTGHVLQSSNGVGLGLWVAPSIFHDNLGNHLATTTLNMSCNPIDSVGTFTFKNGSVFDPASTNLLTTNTSINFKCVGDIFDLDSLTFCTGGIPGSVVLNSLPGAGVAGAPTNELILTSGGPPAIALGIGGPVNPMPFPPVPPPMIPSVLMNGGAIFGVPPVLPFTPPPAIALFNLGVYGEAWAFDWWAFSDERMKKDITPVSNTLQMIRNLNPVSYQMNTDQFPDRNFDKSQKSVFLHKT